MARLYVEPAPEIDRSPAGEEPAMVLGGREFIYTDQDWSGFAAELDEAVDQTLAEAGRHLAAAKALMAGARRLMAKQSTRRALKLGLHVLVLAFLGIQLADLLDGDFTIDGDELPMFTAVIGFAGFEVARHVELLMRMV